MLDKVSFIDISAVLQLSTVRFVIVDSPRVSRNYIQLFPWITYSFCLRINHCFENQNDSTLCLNWQSTVVYIKFEQCFIKNICVKRYIVLQGAIIPLLLLSQYLLHLFILSLYCLVTVFVEVFIMYSRSDTRQVVYRGIVIFLYSKWIDTVDTATWDWWNTERKMFCAGYTFSEDR